jgi:hypothetical protein
MRCDLRVKSCTLYCQIQRRRMPCCNPIAMSVAAVSDEVLNCNATNGCCDETAQTDVAMKFQSSGEVKDSSLRFLPYHHRRHERARESSYLGRAQQTTVEEAHLHICMAAMSRDQCGLR